MSKAKHTPGPWHVYRGRDLDHIWHRNRTVAAYPDGKDEYGDMAVAYCDFHTPQLAEANARLIAAAPDQHAALFDAPAPPENFSMLPPARLLDWSIAYHAWWNNQRRNAIAKATGDAS